MNKIRVEMSNSSSMPDWEAISLAVRCADTYRVNQGVVSVFQMYGNRKLGVLPLKFHVCDTESLAEPFNEDTAMSAAYYTRGIAQADFQFRPVPAVVTEFVTSIVDFHLEDVVKSVRLEVIYAVTACINSAGNAEVVASEINRVMGESQVEYANNQYAHLAETIMLRFMNFMSAMK